MPQNRIKSHPILEIPESEQINFYWQSVPLQAKRGETIAAALIANNIHIFGHHPKDNSPLGLFCANGQCSQCMVLVDGKPIKSCITKVKPGISVMPIMNLPDISSLPVNENETTSETQVRIMDVPVLILGGGPAGLSATIELGKLGVQVLLVDDKSHLGGKLVLQTHRFFGSTDAVYAGTRGIDIAKKLAYQAETLESITVWLETTAVGIFEEKTVGLWRFEEDQYILVKPQTLLVATGARERSLPFKGNTLPGVYGAGAFQTLLNRDLVKPAEKLFIVGGGNVGLIAGYHALQAGINVVGLVEAMPECGGYKVHEDKLARFKVPIFTSHTILEAHGKDHVQSVKIATVDETFKPVPGTEREIDCDCVLIAVGLNPVDEFIYKSEEVGLPVFAAGDASEIAEASAAMYSGKIKGLEIAHYLGIDAPEIPCAWQDFETILKSKPGTVVSLDEGEDTMEQLSRNIFPMMHCYQEIPCDPCASVCPNNLIHISQKDIRSLPVFNTSSKNNCIACERCVAICPGLAITLVDYRNNQQKPIVSIPLEFSDQYIKVGDIVPVTDIDGNIIGHYPVISIRTVRQFSRTLIVRVQVSGDIATKVTGIQLIAGWDNIENSADKYLDHTEQESIVCRCEHISAEEIRKLVKIGVRDINQIKAATKATMGACGGKTCVELIKKIFLEEGIPLEDITEPTYRPVFVEFPLKTLTKSLQKEA